MKPPLQQLGLLPGWHPLVGSSDISALRLLIAVLSAWLKIDLFTAGLGFDLWFYTQNYFVWRFSTWLTLPDPAHAITWMTASHESVNRHYCVTWMSNMVWSHEWLSHEFTWLIIILCIKHVKNSVCNWSSTIIFHQLHMYYGISYRSLILYY